jgi:hypothetical protein
VNWSVTSLQLPAIPKGVWTKRLTSFFVKDHHNALQEIGRLRAQVVSLQADLPPPAKKAKGK